MYENVPEIISCKDLDYLSDMFSWNYLVYKKTYNFESIIHDKEIKDIYNKANRASFDSMMNVLKILNGGGQNE